MWSILGKKISLFGKISNIHGLRFIVNNKENELARLFWMVVLILSGGCMYMLLLPVIRRSDKISFTPDTSYVEWSTVFPAVTVCETFHTSDAVSRVKKLYPSLSFVYNKVAYYSSLLYGKGKYSPRLSTPCGEEIPCDLPWRNISDKVRRGYDELIADCVYNGRSFPCSQHFYIVDSEYGPCFSFNTLQNKKSVKDALFVMNRTTGPSYLSFHLLYNAEVSVHSNEELSTNALDPELKLHVFTSVRGSSRVELLISTVEMKNDVMLQSVNVEDRKCRFPHEVPRSFIHSYPVYSFGACKLAEGTETSMNNCGCVHPIRDLSYQEKYCNLTGLNCLLRYEVDKFLKHGVENNDCVPSCVESELKILHKSYSEYSGWYRDGIRRTLVTIRLASLPTLRYQRNMLRSDLDLVVTIGGLVGLFFGASILSLAETFYLLFRKTSINAESFNINYIS